MATNVDDVSTRPTGGGTYLRRFLVAAHPSWTESHFDVVEDKLRRIGICSVTRLLASLKPAERGSRLNRKLRAHGEKCFVPATLRALEEHAKVVRDRRELRAFLQRAQPHWTPRCLKAVEFKLANVGIGDVDCLIISLFPAGRKGRGLNALLRSANERTFNTGTLEALRLQASGPSPPRRSTVLAAATAHIADVQAFLPDGCSFSTMCNESGLGGGRLRDNTTVLDSEPNTPGSSLVLGTAVSTPAFDSGLWLRSVENIDAEVGRLPASSVCLTSTGTPCSWSVPTSSAPQSSWEAAQDSPCSCTPSASDAEEIAGALAGSEAATDAEGPADVGEVWAATEAEAPASGGGEASAVPADADVCAAYTKEPVAPGAEVRATSASSGGASVDESFAGLGAVQAPLEEMALVAVINEKAPAYSEATAPGAAEPPIVDACGEAAGEVMAFRAEGGLVVAVEKALGEAEGVEGPGVAGGAAAVGVSPADALWGPRSACEGWGPWRERARMGEGPSLGAEVCEPALCEACRALSLGERPGRGPAWGASDALRAEPPEAELGAGSCAARLGTERSERGLCGASREARGRLEVRASEDAPWARRGPRGAALHGRGAAVASALVVQRARPPCGAEWLASLLHRYPEFRECGLELPGAWKTWTSQELELFVSSFGQIWPPGRLRPELPSARSLRSPDLGLSPAGGGSLRIAAPAPAPVRLGLRVRSLFLGRAGAVVKMPLGQPPAALVAFDDGEVAEMPVSHFEAEDGRALSVLLAQPVPDLLLRAHCRALSLDEPTMNPVVLKRAFRQMAIRCSVDRSPDDPAAARMLRMAEEAYSTLGILLGFQ